MSVELVLEDLKKQFGDRRVLYAIDVATILGSSHDRVRRLFNAGSLPLKLIDVGGQRGVSLYAMAQWLSEGEPQGPESPPIDDHGGNKRSTAIPASQDRSSPGQLNAEVRDAKANQGRSLVAKIMSMRHDAASFVVSEVSSCSTLTDSERDFWWSVVKNMDVDRGVVPGLTLKVVRSVTQFEQSTTLRVFHRDELERVRKDVIGLLSDQAPLAVRITLRDAYGVGILLKVMRIGQNRIFVTDRIGFRDSLRETEQD